MAGRGSRSQGVPRATVYLTKDSKGTDVDSILKQNDCKMLKSASEWIKHLFERYPKLQEQCLSKDEKVAKLAKTFRSKVIKALDKGRWLTNDLRDTEDVLTWLEGAKSPYYETQD